MIKGLTVRVKQSAVAAGLLVCWTLLAWGLLGLATNSAS